jgi:hypothetical protein
LFYRRFVEEIKPKGFEAMRREQQKEEKIFLQLSNLDLKLPCNNSPIWGIWGIYSVIINNSLEKECGGSSFLQREDSQHFCKEDICYRRRGILFVFGDLFFQDLLFVFEA